MPKVDDTPVALKPYVFHGVDLSEGVSGDQVRGTCPFCQDDANKFFVNREDGRWNCKQCGEGTKNGGGNYRWFAELLAKMSQEETSDSFLEPLAKDRRLSVKTLREWGVVRHALDGGVGLVGWGSDLLVRNVYSYRTTGGRKAWFCPPGTEHKLFLPSSFDPKRKTVYVCEGVWDGAALWEVLRGFKPDPDTPGKAIRTNNEAVSYLADANVVAIPAANVFDQFWADLFAGKDVILVGQNDHKTHPVTKKVLTASYDGMRRIATVLSEGETPPASVRFLKWGDDGGGKFDKHLKSGYDVRDYLSFADPECKDLLKPSERGNRLVQLLEKVGPIPDDWVKGRSKASVRNGKATTDPEKCETYRELDAAWRKAMRWTPGLDRAFTTMLAAVVSVPLPGDQLWVKIVSPAATGKSSLCEAISVARRYVVSKSKFKGFHSGTDDGTGRNLSPLQEFADKTLVTKDGDTLMQGINLDEVLSEARDIYDRVSRSSYRNGKGKDWEGISMSWILCGTASLNRIDSSELGERFVTCQIMQGIDDEMEDEILSRTVLKTLKAIRASGGKTAETGINGEDADMLRAKRLTGGYIEWLRPRAEELAGRVEVSDAALRKITRLGKFVAYMRARPSTSQEETAERELGSRLTNQFLRLAVCTAVVLNRPEVDDDVMDRVRLCALDTAKGTTHEIAKILHAEGTDGIDKKSISLRVNRGEADVLKLLRFLSEIGAVTSFQPVDERGTRRGAVRWTLTPILTRLYDVCTVEHMNP